MSDSHPARNGDSLRTDLQTLVSDVGLQQGTFELVVHQESIQSLIISVEIRLVISEEVRQRKKPEPSQIHVSAAEQFVHKHLKPRVPELIGDFGSMKVNVKEGQVIDWSFTQRHR